MSDIRLTHLSYQRRVHRHQVDQPNQSIEVRIRSGEASLEEILRASLKGVAA